MVDCIRGVGTVAVRVCREETKPEEVGPALTLKPGGGTAGLKPEAGGHPVMLGAGRRSLWPCCPTCWSDCQSIVDYL